MNKELILKQRKTFIEHIKECNINAVYYPDFIFKDSDLFDDLYTTLELINKLVTIDILDKKTLLVFRTAYDRTIYNMFKILSESQKDEIILFIDNKLKYLKDDLIKYELYEAAANLKYFEEFNYEEYFKNKKLNL